MSWRLQWAAIWGWGRNLPWQRRWQNEEKRNTSEEVGSSKQRRIEVKLRKRPRWEHATWCCCYWFLLGTQSPIQQVERECNLQSSEERWTRVNNVNHPKKSHTWVIAAVIVTHAVHVHQATMNPTNLAYLGWALTAAQMQIELLMGKTEEISARIAAVIIMKMIDIK